MQRERIELISSHTFLRQNTGTQKRSFFVAYNSSNHPVLLRTADVVLRLWGTVNCKFYGDR